MKLDAGKCQRLLGTSPQKALMGSNGDAESFQKYQQKIICQIKTRCFSSSITTTKSRGTAKLSPCCLNKSRRDSDNYTVKASCQTSSQSSSLPILCGMFSEMVKRGLYQGLKHSWSLCYFWIKIPLTTLDRRQTPVKIRKGRKVQWLSIKYNNRKQMSSSF